MFLMHSLFDAISIVTTSVFENPTKFKQRHARRKIKMATYNYFLHRSRTFAVFTGGIYKFLSFFLNFLYRLKILISCVNFEKVAFMSSDDIVLVKEQKVVIGVVIRCQRKFFDALNPKYVQFVYLCTKTVQKINYKNCFVVVLWCI